MSHKKNKNFSDNKQEKLQNRVQTDDSIPHNTKKESEGPNTKR